MKKDLEEFKLAIMAIISRREYASLYGPTTGDLVRLGDTSLFAEVEHDFGVPGEECVVGGGKTMRDGLGVAPGYDSDEGAVDLLITNILVIDPVIGVVKGDLGIKDGKIIGLGKAGNPHLMDGVDSKLIVGAGTHFVSGEGLIATAGGIDCHVHFLSPGLVETALSSGITTLLGGGLGTETMGTHCGGAWSIGKMLQAVDHLPMNFGFLGQGSSSKPKPIVDHIKGGACGLKIHEDLGAMPAVIDTSLSVVDDLDVQLQIHTDTLNEAGYLESTLAAVKGRTIHMYHVEGAGGGHAPDLIRVVGEMNCLPSSTNPTNPYTRNTFDEHLDMTMVAHHLSPSIPEDVAFAESRIRPQTMAAENVLHDMGAISILGSDSMGMGRVNEVICRSWQLASRMKEQRGQLTEETSRGDNERIKRYIAKYTINPARTFGIDQHVGSLEPGKLADIVLWHPAFFGIKPNMVIKGGFISWGLVGDAAASLMFCEPYHYRPLWGAKSTVSANLSMSFVSQLAVDHLIADKLGLQAMVVPVKNTRAINKSCMLHNSFCPEIRVNSETFEVFVNGELASCEPATVLPLTQRYMLR